MTAIPRFLTVALVLAIALASLVIVPRPVAAAEQNRPTWTQGDFWVYSRTEGASTSTIRMEVHERSTVTLALGTYSVWHVTATTTPTGGSATVQHSWVRDSDLGIVKTNFTVLGSEVQVTFDPPLSQAQFPLRVNAQWSLSTTVRVVDTGFNFNIPYSAIVTAEQSTTVPAGTFSVAVVRSPSTGTARDENHYSEGAGNSVREESYDGSGNRVAEQQLTSYRYQNPTTILVIVVVVALAVIVAVALLWRKRRKAVGLPGGPMAPRAAPPPPP